MGVALRLYEQLTEAGEDKTRAKVIAEAFEQLEDRYPPLPEVATPNQVRETELRLQKEIKEVEAALRVAIEQVRLGIKEVEAALRVEIDKVRLEIKEVEARLQKEIKEVELKLNQTEVRLVRAIHRQTFWVIGSLGTIIGFIRLLDWLLANMPK